MKPTGQTETLRRYFESAAGRKLSAPFLHATASPNGHYVGSLSRRVSDLRKLGMNIVLTKDVWVEGRRETGYTFFPPGNSQVTDRATDFQGARAGI